LISLGALKPWGFCAFRGTNLSERSIDACQDGPIAVFRESVMLDQGPLTKALLSYRLGGLVGAYIGFLISSFFSTYFVQFTRILFILICGLIGNAVHGSIQRLFDSLMFKLVELWMLKTLGIITKEKYQELVNQLVEKRILN
jgi:hypothetical protein